MDLTELNNIINEIKCLPKDSFSFKNLTNELDNISFKMKCRNESIKKTKEWIKRNPHHTFPKKKRRWLNALNDYINIRKITFKCDVKNLLIGIKNKSNIPDHLKGLSVYIYNSIKYDENTNEIIGSHENVHVFINEDELYQNLCDIGLLYQQFPFPRVYIYKSMIYGTYNSNMINSNKRERDNDICTENETKIIKKQFCLKKPIFNFVN